MSFRLVSKVSGSESRQGTVTAGTAIAAGEMLAINGNVLERATSASTIHTCVGVATETISTTATTILYTPIIAGQRWSVDVANATAITQLYEGMILSDHDTVNNTDTTVATQTAVFWCDGIEGAIGDKKLLGEFQKSKSTSA